MRNVNRVVTDRREAGQSLVLIALLIILLLAFVGLAVDVGMLFARSSQFSSAVDAATLAGVVDLHADLSAAQQRADDFMNANRWPITVDVGSTSAASESVTPLGYPQLHYTVTYPVETYFLRLLGFGTVHVTHAAAAAVYSWADMPTATQAGQGLLRTAGQFIYGPESCTAQGDPISASWSNNGVPNPFRTEAGATYTYRIRVPAGYTEDLVVQLFDPDSVNLRGGNQDPGLVRSDGAPHTNPSCLSSDYGNGDSCIILTGESTAGNPVWLRRIDETWREYPRSDDDPHHCPIRSSERGGETITRYTLYYYDGDNIRNDHAIFQSGGATDALTDMRWVTPGQGGISSELGSFVIPASTLHSHILADPDNFRSIYLDVMTVQGMSRNGWDLWAGSPADAAAPADGNERNLFILSNFRDFSTDGIEVLAVGYLPTYSYFPDQTPLPLASVSQALGGGTLSLSVFDFEAPSSGPLRFSYSSVTTSDWNPQYEPMCSGSTNCNNAWVEPSISLLIPSPETEPAVAFYGGYLQVNYAMFGDEHVWHATLPLGRPFLTR